MKSQEDTGDEEDKGEQYGSVREESVGSDEARRRQEEVDDLAEEEDDPLEREGVEVDRVVRPSSHHVARLTLAPEWSNLIGPDLLRYCALIG